MSINPIDPIFSKTNNPPTPQPPTPQKQLPQFPPRPPLGNSPLPRARSNPNLEGTKVTKVVAGRVLRSHSAPTRSEESVKTAEVNVGGQKGKLSVEEWDKAVRNLKPGERLSFFIDDRGNVVPLVKKKSSRLARFFSSKDQRSTAVVLKAYLEAKSLHLNAQKQLSLKSGEEVKTYLKAIDSVRNDSGVRKALGKDFDDLRANAYHQSTRLLNEARKNPEALSKPENRAALTNLKGILNLVSGKAFKKNRTTDSDWKQNVNALEKFGDVGDVEAQRFENIGKLISVVTDATKSLQKHEATLERLSKKDPEEVKKLLTKNHIQRHPEYKNKLEAKNQGQLKAFFAFKENPKAVLFKADQAKVENIAKALGLYQEGRHWIALKLDVAKFALTKPISNDKVEALKEAFGPEFTQEFSDWQQKVEESFDVEKEFGYLKGAVETYQNAFQELRAVSQSFESLDLEEHDTASLDKVIQTLAFYVRESAGSRGELATARQKLGRIPNTITGADIRSLPADYDAFFSKIAVETQSLKELYEKHGLGKETVVKLNALLSTVRPNI